VTQTVVFLHSIDDSFGEREHALRFGKGLAAAGVHPVYVVNPRMQDFFSRLGADTRCYRDAAEAVAIVDGLTPRLVVCCEYFNLLPELQRGVAGLRWPLATMDGTTMGEPINLNPLRTAVPLRDFTVPERMVHLRPCPVNDPLPDGDGVFHWSLFPDVRRRDARRARAMFGVPRGARLVLMGVAPWARGAATHLGRMDFYRYLTDVLSGALDAAGEPYSVIIVIGATAEGFGKLGRVLCVPLLRPDVYEELLLGADLVVTDNVLQTSASKALAAGVPTLALVSSTPGAPGTPLAEPYNIFPIAVTFPTDSAYYQALAPVEIGDPAAVAARISAIWRGEPRRGAAYFDALKRLRTPAEILAVVSPPSADGTKA